MFVLGNAKKNMLSTPEEENKYYNENYEIDINNDNNSHSIIVNNALNSKRILDVGCGVGYIGKKLMDLTSCCVDGIEIDKESFEIVSKIYKNTYSFSIEDYDNKDYQKFMNNKEKYDCIIMADVIEHLNDPGEVIHTLSKKLTDNGVFLISTPNIAHIDIISNLINGKFNYNITGILDSTHTKFFTESSFYEFVDNINSKYNLSFGVSTIGKTYAKKNVKNDNLMFDTIGVDIYVYQNIFKLSNEPGEKLKKAVNHYAKLNDDYLQMKEKSLQAKVLEDQIEQLNNKFKEEIQKNKELLKTNNELKRELEKAIIEIGVLKSEREKILNSKSWKITKPLRRITNIKNR